MKEIYIKHISERLGVKAWQVENCVGLFDEGDTIPFISRYRKERTGGLEDVEIAEIKHWADVFDAMEKRKASILETIAAQEKLTPQLQSAIENCLVSTELEDLYLPYRPKRRTRASVARENGLEPLADKMFTVSVRNLEQEASKYISDKVQSVEEALAGARDIIAERISESAPEREEIRRIFRGRRIVSSASRKAADSPEASKYRSYFDFSYPISKIPSHNLLAMLRGENEGYLTIHIDADAEKCGNKLYYDFCQAQRYPQGELAG